MSVIKKITGCVRNRTLLPTLYTSARSRMRVWYVRNDFLRRQLLFNHVYTLCEKKYQRKLDDLDFEDIKDKEIPKTIWISWLQGLDHAPELVKACYKSVCENMVGYQINFISEKNMSEFVDIPDFILNKWKSGIISHPHFSDYLRTALLTQRGGYG